MGKVAAFVALLTLAACQSMGNSQFCDLAKPIRLTQEQIATLTDAQVREYLGHNRRGQHACGWRP